MENDSIGQYRSHDPPKNFALRIKFCKVVPGSVIPSARFKSGNPIAPEVAQDALELVEKRHEEEKEDVVVHWQEKFFSQREFDLYSDPLNCTTSLEQKYHEDVETIKKTYGERPNRRVFTYIDGDSFTVLEEFSQMTLSALGQEPTVLVDKMSKVKFSNVSRRPFNMKSGFRRRKVVVEEPSETFKNNHIITTPSKTMQIMLDLGVNDEFGKHIDDEHIICTIKIDAHGLIVIKPDIDTGEKFTIETYYGTRSVYQYTIEHASEPMNKQEVEQESRLFTELYTRHAQVMASQVGNEMIPSPRKNELFTYYHGEIVSAKNFEYDNLYVEYFIDLPTGWQSGSKNLAGVTQSCSMNKENVAHFSYPFEFEFLYTWLEDNPIDFIKWPMLYFQVFSLDSWQRHRIEGYGYCQLSDVSGTTCVEIDMWRPIGDDNSSEMDRFFIGGTPELKDLTYVKEPQDSSNEGHLSKYFFKTVSTGTLTVKLSTIFHTKGVDSGSLQKISKWKKTIRRAGGFAAAVDSLTHVLDAFQRARKRMLAARSTLPTIK